MSVGPAEILLILFVALLVFGPHRLPEVSRQIGSAVRELRKMQDSVKSELDMVLNPEHGTGPTHEPAAAIEPDDHSVVDGQPVVDGPAVDDFATDPEAEADPRFSGPDSFS